MMRLLLLCLFLPVFLYADDDKEELFKYFNNKQVPERIQQEALTALSHYPSLVDTDIRFYFSQRLKGPVMAARPVVWSLLRKRSKRTYEVVIHPQFKLKHLDVAIDHIPDSVLIGWIAHELGHIQDYETKNMFQMVGFGLRYWLFKRFIKKAERKADTYATRNGLGSYLVAHKDFVLGHADMPEAYKERISRLYLSPDDIVKLIAQMEEEMWEEQEEILEEVEELYAD